jgi:hypothetical protein
MFSAARCSQPLHSQPHAGIPRPRPRCGTRTPTAVSAAPRRRSTRGPHRDSSWDDGSGDSDDDRIDADFFGPEQDDDDEPIQSTRAASPEPQLRGTDVLRALQRAAAAKEAKKKKDKKPAARPRQGKEKLKAGGEVALDGEARPVVVKPEWAARIRELELRVKELTDKYHQ